MEETGNPMQNDGIFPETFELDNDERGSIIGRQLSVDPGKGSRISVDPGIDKVLNVKDLKNLDGTDMKRDADLLGSYVNLTNSIIGGGTLGLPYAFAGCGWILGTILVVLFGVATCFSLHLLTLCALKVPPPSSFYKVAKAAIPDYAFLVDVAVAFQTFGVALSYLIIIGGLMPDVSSYLGGSGLVASRYLWITIGFCVVAPMSCLKTQDALKYVSMVAIFFIIFIALLIFSYSVDPDVSYCDDDSNDCVGTHDLATVNIDTFKVLGVFIFAYTCQMNMFPVVNELNNPTMKRFDIVAVSSISTAGAIYLLVAASGYAIYGSSVEADVLVSFPDTPVTTVARIFTSLLVCFSYPVLCLPGRSSILSLISLRDPPGFELSRGDQKFRFYAVTAGFLLGTYGLAMATSELGVVLALIGATGATVITYILPGAAYYAMHPPGTGPAWKRNIALGYVIFGCFIMPFCVTFIFV